MRNALVLLNLGTPEVADPKDVGVYLRQFLMDPYVLDVPYLLRWLLVNVLIVPRRRFKTAKAYQKIWTPWGSPLRTNTEALAAEVQRHRPSGPVKGCMRYGSPSVASVLAQLRKDEIHRIDFLPLYPQYALSSTETAIDEVRRVLRKMKWNPQVRVFKPFYAQPDYIEGLAARFRATAETFKPDFVLMSYHGLPKRHLLKLNKACVAGPCCAADDERRQTCYRNQAFATSKALARSLGLREDQWQVSFQSRLGPGWIQPFTDRVFVELAKKGVRRLAVLCPSFVCDCLETLEEIAQRGRQLFVNAGGEDLCLVPALNADPNWAKAIASFSNDQELWTGL